MGSFGECRICGAKIVYAPEDVGILGLHLLEKHSNVKVTQFSFQDEPQDQAGVKKKCSCTCKGCERTATFTKQKQHYRTSIESWRMAQNPYECPKCGKKTIPLIRRQRHKLARTPMGSIMLLGCWPLCFLPFILGGSDLMYLHCRECGNFLGMFDRRVPADGNTSDVQPCKCR